MTRAPPLSDFDVLHELRLPNWGRAGRCDTGKPDPEAVCGGIYDMGRAPDIGDNWVATESAPDDSLPVFHKDAEELDAFIRQTPQRHKEVIINYYYKRSHVRLDDVWAAIRALMDTMEANKATNKRMRELM